MSASNLRWCWRVKADQSLRNAVMYRVVKYSNPDAVPSGASTSVDWIAQPADANVRSNEATRRDRVGRCVANLWIDIISDLLLHSFCQDHLQPLMCAWTLRGLEAGTSLAPVSPAERVPESPADFDSLRDDSVGPIYSKKTVGASLAHAPTIASSKGEADSRGHDASLDCRRNPSRPNNILALDTVRFEEAHLSMWALRRRGYFFLFLGGDR